MGKLPSDYPRFVTYFTEEEAAQIKNRASKAKMGKPQKWIASVIRKILSQVK